MELITLQTFHLAHNAYLLKSILDNEGIESYIFDEHLVTANPMYSNTVGGIKLKIRKRDFEKTCEVLKGTDFEVIFKREEEQSPNFTKHILSLLFSKEAIATIVVCILIILFFYFKYFLRHDDF